jgi:hypothetical protein
MMRDTVRMQASDDLKATLQQIEALEARIAACELASDEAALGPLRIELETTDHRRRNIQRFLDMHDARIGWMERTGQLETEAAPQAAPARPMVRRQAFGLALG